MSPRSDPETPRPPHAPRRPHRVEVHGHVVVDEYRWLHEREDPAVRAHLERENAYTEAVAAPMAGLRERLYEELRERIRETDVSAPVRYGGFTYYTRTEQGLQYPIHCRRGVEDGAPEEVLLDLNELAAGKPYLRLGVFALSPDHRLLAYSTDETGGESYTLVVKDLASGALLDEPIPGTADSATFAADSASLVYTCHDEAQRPDRVLLHRLGTSPAADVELLHEPDERFYASVSRTRSGVFVVVQLDSRITSEALLLDAADPAARPRLVASRRQGVEYSVDHHGDHLYLLTNDAARDFRVLRAPLAQLDAERWEEVVPHRPGVVLESMALFDRHMVLGRREAGLRGLEIHELAGGAAHALELDEPLYSARLGWNPSFDTSVVRVVYSSLVTPQTALDYDCASRQQAIVKRDEIRGYDPAAYVAERLWVTAADGDAIPVSLVRPRDVPRDGTAPCWLYGYGAYGMTIEPAFSPHRLSLLERGFVYAIAHVRGGGALGRDWYDAGKLAQKTNTFADFEAVAEYLVREGYAEPRRVVGAGASAGGLLIGAVANRRPDLFAALVANVPFVDVVHTMLDPALPLTVIEYEEWGDPRRQDAFETMLAYSPYENITDQPYPPLLVTAGLHDPRVLYWGPAKWVARLRERATGGPFLLKTQLGAGHAGASGRYQRLEELAFELAFGLDAVGLT
jgi:oligopeptidase B